MIHVPAYCEPLATKPDEGKCPMVPSVRWCWYDGKQFGSPCKYYQGTTGERGYGPVTVLCSAPVKKEKGPRTR